MQLVLGRRSASAPMIASAAGGADGGLEAVAQAADAVPVGREIQRGAEADDAGQVLGAGAAAQLLAAAALRGRRVEAVAQDEGADAGRAAELVGGDGEEVDAEARPG